MRIAARVAKKFGEASKRTFLVGYYFSRYICPGNFIYHIIYVLIDSLNYFFSHCFFFFFFQLLLFQMNICHLN